MYESLFKKNNSPHLRAYVVWVPEFFAKEKDVPVGVRTVPDVRATHYWDGHGVLTAGYSPVLGLPTYLSGALPAWDVFMIFAPQAKWTGSRPPKPDFWMHQLSAGGIRAPRLRPVEFARKAEEFLRPCMAAAGPPSRTAGPAILAC